MLVRVRGGAGDRRGGAVALEARQRERAGVPVAGDDLPGSRGGAHAVLRLAEDGVLPDLLEAEGDAGRRVGERVRRRRVGVDPEVVPGLDARVVAEGGAGRAQRAVGPRQGQLRPVHHLGPGLAEVFRDVRAVERGGRTGGGRGEAGVDLEATLHRVEASGDLLRVLHDGVDEVVVLARPVRDAERGAADDVGGREAVARRVAARIDEAERSRPAAD